MLGSASTQQLFASANSIAVVPNVWAEWNYNNFIQPEITSSSATAQKSNGGELLSGLWNNVSTWDTTDVSLSLATSGGKTSISDTSGSSTLLAQITSNTGYGQITSPYKTQQTGSNFYKIVFYVKTYGTTITSGYPSLITSGSVTNVTSPGTSSVYYKVVGVSSNNNKIGMDTITNLDLITASNVTSNVSNVTLKWKSDPNAASYQIYKSFNKNSSYVYSGNTPSASYVDKVGKVGSAYAPSTFKPSVEITTSVIGSDTNGNLIDLVYYVKSSDFEKGQLTKKSNSIEASTDLWKRVEVWVAYPYNLANKSTIQWKSQISLSLRSSVVQSQVLISEIKAYPITEQDFYLNEYYPTESAFHPYRPGEALGNILLSNSDKTIKNYTIKPSTKPVSFGFKNPTTYSSSESTSPYIQILPSTFDKFKYYITPPDSGANWLYGQYNKNISINKIVLKMNNAVTSLRSGLIVLYCSDNTIKTINLTNLFSNSGYNALYYDGANWSTNAWTSPPKLTASGTLQNTLSINAIAFAAGTPIPINSKIDKLAHIVELSPRLEVDLSDYLISYDITKQLSFENKNGFPFSYINSNSGNLTLSNIPVYSNTGAATTVFENGSKNSPFYGLLRQGVKLTGFLTNPSFSTDLTEKIPLFYMYSDSWSTNDIDTVSINMFDALKAVTQSAESPAYACENNDLFSIVTDLFAIVGFSDYDYDSLKYICENSFSTNNFWYDQQKTIFDNLQELFVVHQIGAFIDEYGILRFKSLYNTMNEVKSSNFATNFAITDISSSAGNYVSYIPNIVLGSFNEQVQPKIGKIVLRYTVPKKFGSTDINSNNGKLQKYNKFSESMQQVWQEQDEVGLASFELDTSLLSSDSYMQINTNSVYGSNPRQYLSGFEGEIFVGNEIVGYSGMEYIFHPFNSTDQQYTISKIVKNEYDIQDGISKVLDMYSPGPGVSKQVEFYTNGKVFNLERGKYGTPVSDHYSSDKTPGITTKFDAIHLNSGLQNFGSILGLISTNTWINSREQALTPAPKFLPDSLLLSAGKQNYRAVIPLSFNNTTYSTSYGNLQPYNFFAIDFQIPISGKDNLQNTTSQTNLTGKTTKTKPKDTSNWKYNKKKKIYEQTTTFNRNKDFEFGMFFNLYQYSPGSTGVFSATTPTTFKNTPYFVSISNSSKQKTPQCLLSVYYFDSLGVQKYLMKNKAITNIMDGQDSDVSKQPVGWHRLSFYVQDNHGLKIAIDNELVAVISGTSVPAINNGVFGVFARSLEDSISVINVKIKEIYADVVQDENKKQIDIEAFDISSRYHFTSTPYLNNIIRNVQNENLSFLWQAKPQVRGLKIYDAINYTTSPIDPETAFIFPHIYGSTSVAGRTNEQSETLGPVINSDLQKSNLFTTPFNAKFALANNTNEIVYISNPKNKNDIQPLFIKARNQEMSQERIKQRITDPSNQSNSIELQSRWINQESDLNKLLSLLSKSLETFYSTYTINLFGNPLIQVGDYAKLTYSLKRIGYDNADTTVTPVYCLVTDVKQSFSGGVGETQLTINPMIT